MTLDEAVKVVVQILSTLTFKLNDLNQAKRIQEAINVLENLAGQTK